MSEFAGNIKRKAYQNNKISEADKAEFEPRDNPPQWRVTRKYAIRSLEGIWATAPYLHNNSVPTLYDLLLPSNRRPQKFYIRTREYNPEKLGYADGGDPSKQFLFDTTITGNNNSGHEGKIYGTELSEEERYDLLEFLKGH